MQPYGMSTFERLSWQIPETDKINIDFSLSTSTLSITERIAPVKF